MRVLQQPLPVLLERITETVVYYGNIECYHAKYIYDAHWEIQTNSHEVTQLAPHYSFTLCGLIKTKLL